MSIQSNHMHISDEIQVEVNRDQCLEVARVIKPLHPRPGFYERPYLRVDAPEETLFRMHFFAVAICHHTYNLHHRALDLYGWDYIEYAFAKMAAENSKLLDVDFLAETATSTIADALCKAFSENGDPDASTLDRSGERARLMHDAAHRLKTISGGSVSLLFERSEGYLRGSSTALYEALPEFEAYADPQQKKSTFLIKLLSEAGLVRIEDPENFIPIMDYHMQRVLLRLGCVEITDAKLRDQLISREELPTDEPVRSACIDAFRIVAAESGHPVIKMNDYFWSLGRSCCNETMLCRAGHCEKNPCSFNEIVDLPKHERCIFENICKGAAHEAYSRLWQPVVQTHFY